jgi:glutamine synthetase
MEDVNISNDLQQLAHSQVKVLEYSCCDINGYRFRTMKFEAGHSLAVITNNEVVTSGEDAIGHVTDYYDIPQNSIEYMFGGTKELRVVFFQCDWFDPINDTRVDDFGMVNVKHGSSY